MPMRITISDGPHTRLGWIALAGSVEEDEPVMPRTLRTIDDYVVSLVLSGEGQYRDEERPAVPITASTLTVVPPNWPHRYSTPPGRSWTEWFVVAGGPLLDLLADRGVLDEPGPRPLDWPSGGDDLALILGNAPRTAVDAERQLIALADWLTTASARRQPLEDPWAQAADRLAADLAGRVDLAELADQVGTSYDGFRRGFRRRFGAAPLAYRNARRLESAAALLRLTDLPLHGIAERLGFTDEFYLSRQFRRRYGMPPRDYRREQQSGA